MSGLEGLLAGRVLGGRYRIEEVIGRGGMGAVYRAVDERLGRQVAVKVITVVGSDADSRERLRARFHREARAAAALPHHPNVVPVYDYGTDDALGLDYLVMEFLRGTDLATRFIRSGAPPLAAGLRILREAAQGVAVGHRAGLIHRDVKPGNIFLAESPHHEIQVRVLDFGIAKLASDEDTTSQLTQDGRAPHSPAYASPEQLRGLTHLTPASDVFSLGAVGFQLLTGERPFSDSDRNRMSLGMPVPVPAVRSRNPAVPGAVEAIVQRALAFDAADRFPDAGAMAAALDEAMRVFPETPLEPYIASASAAPPRGSVDDDRTEFMEPGRAAADDGDHTLLAPEAGAPPPPTRPAPAAAEAAATAAASRRRGKPEPPRKRRNVGSIILWTLVLLLVAGGIYAALSSMGGRPQAAQQPDSIPPAPDTTPVVVAPPEENTVQDDAMAAAAANEDGLRAFGAADYQTALTNFERAVRLVPESAEYRNNYALALLRLGRPTQAAVELDRAVQLDPDRDKPYANLFEARLAVHDTAGAIAAGTRYVNITSDRAGRFLVERKLAELQAAQAGGSPAPADTTQPPDTGLIRFPLPPAGQQ